MHQFQPNRLEQCLYIMSTALGSKVSLKFLDEICYHCLGHKCHQLRLGSPTRAHSVACNMVIAWILRLKPRHVILAYLADYTSMIRFSISYEFSFSALDCEGVNVGRVRWKCTSLFLMLSLCLSTLDNKNYYYTTYYYYYLFDCFYPSVVIIPPTAGCYY